MGALPPVAMNLCKVKCAQKITVRIEDVRRPSRTVNSRVLLAWQEGPESVDLTGIASQLLHDIDVDGEENDKHHTRVHDVGIPVEGSP